MTTAQAGWTGREAEILRRALRLTQRDFANGLGVGTTTVERWAARGENAKLTADSQALLDTVLKMASDDVRDRFAQGLREYQSAREGAQEPTQQTPNVVVDTQPSPDVKLDAPA